MPVTSSDPRRTCSSPDVDRRRYSVFSSTVYHSGHSLRRTQLREKFRSRRWRAWSKRSRPLQAAGASIDT